MAQQSGPSFNTKVLPKSEKQELDNGIIQGIHLIMHPDEVERILHTIEQWYDDRDDISVIDTGTTGKRGDGFIILEWLEYEIDPVFLDVLENDKVIKDYTTYETEV